MPLKDFDSVITNRIPNMIDDITTGFIPRLQPSSVYKILFCITFSSIYTKKNRRHTALHSILQVAYD